MQDLQNGFPERIAAEHVSGTCFSRENDGPTNHISSIAHLLSKYSKYWELLFFYSKNFKIGFFYRNILF